MPTTRADSYSAASGGGIYAGVAGPGNVPAAGVARTFAMIGDSMNSHAFGGGAIRWVNAMMGAPFTILANSAFNGRTLAQLSTEMGNDYTAATAPGLGGLPALGWLFIEIGTGTARGLDASPGVDLTPTLEGYFETIVTDALTRAEIVVLGGLQPLGGLGGIANKSAVFGAWNAYIQNLAETHPSGRVYYIYDGADLADVDGVILTQYYLGDYGHNNSAGNRQRALSSLAQWQALLANQTYASPLITDAAHVYPAYPQWNPNHVNAGTGGTFGSGWSGTCPDGMRIEGNGAGTGGTVAIVAADVGDSNTTPWVEVTPTSSQAGSNISISSTGSGRTITTTDPETLEQLVEVEFIGLQNHIGLAAWIQASGALKLTEVPLEIGWAATETLTESLILEQKLYRQNPSATGSTTHYIYVAGGATASGAMGKFRFRNATVEG